MQQIVGLLEAFSDQGTEGICWCLIDNDDNKVGFDSLVSVEDGDYLFVEDGNHNIEWEGVVDLRTDTNLELCPYSKNGESWQRVSRCTVHGLQDAVEPNVWFEWFVTNRPAVLIKHHD